MKRKIKPKPKTKIKPGKSSPPLEKESDADFDKVSDILDRYGIPEMEPLPEEYSEYLEMPFGNISELLPDELHDRMAACTYQISYLETLVSNAEIEVRQLEREYNEVYHDNYNGQNKKLAAEKAQLDSGVWEELDVSKGVLARVQVEHRRLENLYRYLSRVLSSRQERL